jgi:ligand-binding SRPBCC domain-containing protein
MKILIKTKIEKNYQVLFSKFNVELFKALKPPLVNLDIERFDGCKKGDEIHLRMDVFGQLNQRWISLITSDFKSDYEINFVDEGALLPPPLVKWKHVHRIEKINETSSLIVDDIYFTSGNIIVDLAIYPALYLMFLYRKPIYKRELS